VAESLWTLNGWARVGGSASVCLGRSQPGATREWIACLDEPAQALYGVATTGNQSGTRLDATIASDRVELPLVAVAFLPLSLLGGLTVRAWHG
jgi:hypothetical protein